MGLLQVNDPESGKGTRQGDEARGRGIGQGKGGGAKGPRQGERDKETRQGA